MNLHPRAFYSQELATRGHSAAIDPTKYTASTLIAQIADGWLLYTQNTDNMSDNLPTIGERIATATPPESNIKPAPI